MPADLPDALCAAVIDQCADVIIFSDRDGIIRLWNRAAERMFGFTAAEALGRSLDIIIPLNLRERHWAGYHQAMESAATKHQGRAMRTKALDRAGDAIYAEVSFSVVTDAAHRALGAVAMARPA